MTFEEYPYKRPNMFRLRLRATLAVAKMRFATRYEAFKLAFFAASAVHQNLMTMRTMVEIRHSIDTRDSFYDAENEFFNEAIPKILPVFVSMYEALLESRFCADFEKEYGRQIIAIAKISVERFSKKLVPFMIAENKLSSEYEKLLASCDIELNGERRNLVGISKLMQSSDRSVRKQAFDAYASFFEANEEKFDILYDKLVHVRDAMAKKLGYENFIPLGYMNLSRTDYDAAAVARFREQVKRDLVPVCTRLREEQAKRIGVDKVRYYDEAIEFPDGNATPIGDKDELVAQALSMYEELSPETGEFFRFMCKRKLMDLETKPGKAAGGFCTFLPDYASPFIFSNFNGTSADVDVLTHEAGHAFQAYRAVRSQKLSEYWESTYEVCEIHSMSMEYFAYPWIEKFFGDKADKYRKLHTIEGLTFVPYGVLVDEFQHRVYEKPNMTPAERKALWHALEGEYLPTRDYDGKAIFERGAFFFKQLHIFMDPFYYIDYTLASMGAFEFYGRMRQDSEAAFADYIKLCDLAGSLPYLSLLKEVNLHSPFEDGSVKNAIAPLVKELGIE